MLPPLRSNFSRSLSLPLFALLLLLSIIIFCAPPSAVVYSVSPSSFFSARRGQAGAPRIFMRAPFAATVAMLFRATPPSTPLPPSLPPSAHPSLSTPHCASLSRISLKTNHAQNPKLFCHQHKSTLRLEICKRLCLVSCCCCFSVFSFSLFCW